MILSLKQTGWTNCVLIKRILVFSAELNEWTLTNFDICAGATFLSRFHQLIPEDLCIFLAILTTQYLSDQNVALCRSPIWGFDFWSPCFGWVDRFFEVHIFYACWYLEWKVLPQERGHTSNTSIENSESTFPSNPTDHVSLIDSKDFETLLLERTHWFLVSFKLFISWCVVYGASWTVS